MNQHSINAGDIIYHPKYGFGIMKELPTFKGMMVTGIRTEIILADDLLKDKTTLKSPSQ